MSPPTDLDEDRGHPRSPLPPAAASSHRPKARRERLPPDQHLLQGEQPYELIDGKLIHVVPSLPPHATTHFDLGALLRAHINSGYLGGIDLLTRVDQGSDFAADVSVFSAKKTKRGGRKLEELAFEVLSTQTRADAAEKASRLSERGVRKVFAIDVKRGEVLSWDKRKGAWQALAADGEIADKLLAKPIPVRALLDAGRVEDEMARALFAKKNLFIASVETQARAEGEAKGKAEGEAKGKADAVLAMLKARGVALSEAEATSVATCRDIETLDIWIVRAATAASVAEVLGRAARRRKR